ncbi:hypothetical protein [Merismopedia glauca]|nr:hypothetical protein [Merismopedia glauca]
MRLVTYDVEREAIAPVAQYRQYIQQTYEIWGDRILRILSYGK